jgi:hypothetical protein
MLRTLSLISCCFLFSTGLSAQTRPAAEGYASSVWVGAEVSTFNPDYGCDSASPFVCGDHQLLGFAPLVYLNNVLLHRIGVEGEARLLHWRGPTGGVTESSYLAGPRFAFLRWKKAYFIGKVGVGNANIAIPKSPGDGNHFAYAPGFIAEFKLRPRFTARTEYEYQFWPNFKGVPTKTTSGCCGLTPNGFSLGFSYEVHKTGWK